jgi:hypothetical protein
MESLFTAFGLTAAERRQAQRVNPLALSVLRESGVKERPTWRETWVGSIRTIEFSTRRQIYLAIPDAEFSRLIDREIVDRLCRRLSEGSTMQFP